MARDYSAAIASVFGPKPEAVNADAFSGRVSADALDTSGGIRTALDAEPGLMEQRARQAFTPAPPVASPVASPVAPEPAGPAEYLLNPTSTWYTPPERKEPRGVSTDTLRLQMAEREALRHAVLPEGPEDDGSGGLLRASFMLNSASRHKMDDVFSAASLSGALGMPLGMTLDSLDTARELAAEFTPEKIKTFAPGFLRLVQHDYDAAMLWRHDLPTANAVSSAFEGWSGLSGGLGLAEEIRNRERPEADSFAAALERGVHSAFTMLSQAALNLGKLGLEGLAATVNPSGEELPAYLPEGYKQFLKDGKAALLDASDSLGGLVREMSARRKEMALDSPLAGLRVWDEPEIMLDSRWWAENVPGVVASFLPIAGAYARGGEIAGGLAGLLFNGNEVYTDLLDKGLEDNADTRLYALLGGTAMSALDVLGLHGIFGGREAVREGVRQAVQSAVKGGLAGAAAHAGKRAGTGFLLEGSTEYAQNLIKAGVEAIAQDKDFGGVVADMADAAKQLEDFILGGLMGGVVSGVSGAASPREERDRQQFEALRESIAAAARSEEVSEARAEVEAVAREAEDARSRMAFARSLQGYIDATDASPLHASAPAVYERESARLIPENLRSVWLDADFVQEFVTEDGARLEALGLSAREVAEALQLQAGSVRVDTARLVSRFQGEERTLLLREARMAPGGLTLTEARAFDPQARMEAAAERIRARSATDAETGGERTRLKEEYVRAGYAPHLAEYYATLHAEQAKTFAARYGLDAAALLRQRSVVRGKSGEMTDGGKGTGILGQPVNYDVKLDAPVRVVTITPRFTGQNPKVLRKRFPDDIRQSVLDEFNVKGVVNADTGRRIGMSGADFREHMKFSDADAIGGIAQLEAVAALPDMMRQAKLVESYDDRKGNPNIKKMHRFQAALRIGEKDYSVKLTVKEFRNGVLMVSDENPVKLYHHRVEKEMPAGNSDTLRSPGVNRPSADTSEYTLRALLEDVKDSEGQPFFSADGRSGAPAVVVRGKSGEMTDGGGLHQAALYEQTPLGDTARASLERDIRDFGAAVDNIVAAGVPPRQPVKMLGQTPLVMRLLGRDTVTGKAAAQGGVYAAPHVFDGTHPNMTPELWKQIPAALADPVAVFDSDSPKGRANGDLVFMLELTDADGATVVVPVALDASEGRNQAHVNIVKSAYAKENSGVPANRWFLRQLKKNARYVNGQKMKRWLRAAGADSPLGSWKDLAAANASGNRIYTDADLVKLREAQPTLYQSGRGEAAAPGGNEKAQRFAALPPIEADSSLWFGPGKAIEADSQNMRKAVHDWARTAFPKGTTVANADTGWRVQVTPAGIKASLHHGFDETLARSVPFIPQIVESGIHLDSIEKKPGLMSHIFANRIRLDGQEYVVGFVLREDRTGSRFYDHELTKIIDPDWLKPGRDTSEEALGHRTNRGDVMNILRDRLGVNDGTGQVLFQARESGTPAVVVRGDELGVPDGADIREYIAAAKTYHDALKYESEHGRPVMQPQLERPVRFSGKGWRKNTYGGANIDKWKLFPKLREIIETSTLIRTEAVNKPRKDGFTRFHWVENSVELDGTLRRVGLMLAEDTDGNLFYNLNADVEGWAQKSGSSNLPGHSIPGESEPLYQSADAPVEETLPAPDDGVNLMFLSGPADGRNGVRGMVRFDDDGASVTTIFADAADLSTPIHEGAHVFINDLIRVVADDGATARRRHEEELAALANDATLDAEKRQEREARLLVRRNGHLDGVRRARADLAALVANANAQREAHGKAIGADLPPVTLEEVLHGTASPAQLRTLQEVNAAAFEAYVLEGRAPSSRLAAVFHRMRQWLAALYRRAVVHGVKPTPEVRRVFDRMLATDEAIRRRDRTAAMLDDERNFLDMAGGRLASDMADDDERLQELYGRAEAEVTARMDRATLKERNRRWREYYAEGRDVAAHDPLYAILDALAVRNDDPYSGISRDWLERQYGRTAAEDFLKTAAGRRIINRNGGQPLDAVDIGGILGDGDRAALMGLDGPDGLYIYLHDNIVVRRRTAADDARAWADRRLAGDDARAEALLDDPSQAYSRYLEEVEATVIRLAARQGAEWRTPEQRARWVEDRRKPLAELRRRVRDALRQRRLRDIQPNQFAGEVRKAGRERNAALAAGDALEALAALDRARTALESWREANRIRKEQEAFERLAQRLGALERDVVTPEAWTGIQDLLQRFRLVAPRKRTGEAPLSLERIISDLCGDAAEISGLPAVPDWLLNENTRAVWRDLTPERMRDLSDTLRMLEHLGRQAVAANRESEAARIEEAAEAGARAMKGLAPVGEARDGTLRQPWQDANRSFFGGMLPALQWLFRQADGARSSGPERGRGINEERLYGGILDGESRREMRMRGFVAQLEPVFRRLADSARAWEKERGKTLTGRDGKPLPVPKVMLEGGKSNWTSDMVIALALNLGNEGNVQRLREGYPDLTADTLAQLVGDDAARLVFAGWRGRGDAGLLSAQDWRDVQEIGNILHTQWHDIQATHERMFGFRPRGVDARPMTIRVGGETVALAGWHYPVVHDPALSDDVRRREERRDAVVRTKAVLAAPPARRGSTRSRGEGGGAPLRLATGVIMSHLADVTRFIELAEVVRFADRVTRSPQWRSAYIRAFGRQDYEAIRPSLKGVVLEERPPREAIGRSADRLREKLVPWGLAFHFKTAIRQAAAVFPAMTDTGAANVLRGVGAVAKGRTALVRQIWEVSPYMKSRAGNIDQDLRRAMRGIDAETRRKALRGAGHELGWDDVVEFGMLPLAAVDMAASCSIWMAAYNAELARLTDSAAFRPGGDMQSARHEAAVRAADMAVKAVDPDLMSSSRSALLHGRGAVRLLSLFSSAVALFAQRRAANGTAARKAWAGATDAGGRAHAATSHLRCEFFDLALQGVAMGLILSLAYGEDDAEKIGGGTAAPLLDSASMRVPAFNAVLTGLITGDTWRGMSTAYPSPREMAQRVRDALKTEGGDALARSLADIICFMASLPVSRVARNAARGHVQRERDEGPHLSRIMPRPGK